MDFFGSALVRNKGFSKSGWHLAGIRPDIQPDIRPASGRHPAGIRPASGRHPAGHPAGRVLWHKSRLLRHKSRLAGCPAGCRPDVRPDAGRMPAGCPPEAGRKPAGCPGLASNFEKFRGFVALKLVALVRNPCQNCDRLRFFVYFTGFPTFSR